jgi:LysR family transcriptional regulator, hydrogen peroxide-inducible genes activator
MTLTELRYIVAVARERHFGRAAAACFVSQPTLSVAVKKLEESLGVIIFERSAAEVTLTPIGAQVVEQAQRVLEESDAIKTIAKRGKDPLAGTLTLGTIFTVGPYLLPHLVPTLAKRAPNMPLSLCENYTDRLIEQLKQGEVDAIVVATPVDDASLASAALYDEPFVVALPRGHRWASRKTIAAADLAQETTLLLGSGHCFRDQVLEICPALNRTTSSQGLQKSVEGSSLETIRLMVASGMGITVLPALSTAKDARTERLMAYLRFTRPVPNRRVSIVWRKRFARPAALEAVRLAVLSCGLSDVAKLDEPISVPAY